MVVFCRSYYIKGLKRCNTQDVIRPCKKATRKSGSLFFSQSVGIRCICIFDANQCSPVAVPEKIIGLTLFLDFFDRCLSLTSLHLPPAALGSLPPAGHAIRILRMATRAAGHPGFAGNANLLLGTPVDAALQTVRNLIANHEQNDSKKEKE